MGGVGETAVSPPVKLPDNGLVGVTVALIVGSSGKNRS